LDAIREDPDAMLGPKVHQTFGKRLPFLMKLLAAGEPLSLQVHPSSERARIRFSEQNAAGVPMTATERSYQDASHKPELVYALTRFEGMAGFRDPRRTAVILRRLHVQWLDAIADRLESTTTPFQTLRAIVTEMLALDGPELTARLNDLRKTAVLAERDSHAPQSRRRPPVVDPSDVDRESTRVYAATVPLIDQYPNDPGVLVTLLLNHVVLAAGEAMFIDAGVIHAYTSGFGIEIMAASDNVLRAGLTPKYVDIPELLEIANFTPMPPPRWGAQAIDVGLRLSPPVDEFELLLLGVSHKPVMLRHAGPQVVLCLEGSVQLSGANDGTVARPGQTVYLAPSEGPIELTGAGRIAVGRTPT